MTYTSSSSALVTRPYVQDDSVAYFMGPSSISGCVLAEELRLSDMSCVSNTILLTTLNDIG